jgi:hypothetical protein
MSFNELVRRKQAVTEEIYFNDSIDLFVDGRKYLLILSDILSDIQKLS